MNKRGVIVQAEAGDSEIGVELEIKPQQDGLHGMVDRLADIDSPEAREFEQTRRDYINTLKELRKKYPTLPLEQLEVMAHEEVLGKGPKSRAFYRVQATRKMVGAGNLSRKISERAQSDLSEVKAELQKAEAESIDIENVNAMRVFFEPGHYTVMENVGTFEVGVTRAGGDLNKACSVDYCTEDGSAEAGSDYVSAKGTLTFEPGETKKTIKLSVIDDELFEEDEHFYVRSVESIIVSLPKTCDDRAVRYKYHFLREAPYFANAILSPLMFRSRFHIPFMDILTLNILNIFSKILLKLISFRIK